MSSKQADLLPSWPEPGKCQGCLWTVYGCFRARSQRRIEIERSEFPLTLWQLNMAMDDFALGRAEVTYIFSPQIPHPNQVSQAKCFSCSASTALISCSHQRSWSFINKQHSIHYHNIIIIIHYNINQSSNHLQQMTVKPAVNTVALT